MSKNINKLTTPAEFSEYYFKELKNELDLTEINLNRLGFIGFFIELLGNVQFDVKNYYNYLFGEAFPITATDDLNLLYHSSVYGYQPFLAKPSEIIGVLNFSPLATNTTDVDKREIFLNKISFILDGIQFYLDSFYKITYTKTKGDFYSMSIEISYNDIYDIVPVLYSNSSVKSVGFLQYSVSEYFIYIPNYAYGSNYIYNLKIQDYVYDVEIHLKDLESQNKYPSDEEGFIPYKTSMTNVFLESNEEIVLYNILADNTLQLKFGSGIRGKYVPGAHVKLKIKTTKGEKGNVGENLIKTFSGQVVVKDYKENFLVSESTASPSAFLSLNIASSIGGQDPSLGEKLKKELLEFIQTRENLVSETDFHNTLKDYSAESEILFKKTEISENIIYLYALIRDKYNYPIYTLTESVPRNEFEDKKRHINNKTYIVNPEFVRNNRLFNCPFYFEYNNLLGTYDGYVYFEEISFYPGVIPDQSTVFPKDLFISLIYDYNEDITHIYVNTKTNFFNNFNINTITLTSQILNLNEQLVLNEEDQYEFHFPGIIKTPSSFNIEISIIDSGANGIYRFYNIQNVYDEVSNLRLRFYKLPTLNDNNELVDVDHVINLPLIDTVEYCKNKLFYTNLIKNLFERINIRENRMLSDEIQLRFLNTYSSELKFNSSTLLTDDLDSLSFDIMLPLKLEVNIIFSLDSVIEKQFSFLNILQELKLEISKYLLTVSGIKLAFYKTKIIDICHNNSFVKSVEVIFKDAHGNNLPRNLETLEKNKVIETIDKQLYLQYTPIYWWFDVNNIEMRTTLL